MQVPETATARRVEDYPGEGYLSSRSESTRDRHLQDLEYAIAQSEAVVEATPAGGLDSALCIGSELILHCQYERLQVLGHAIPQSEDAVEASTQDHPNQADPARRLTNLVYLHGQYVRTGNLEDMEHAIAQSKAVLEVIPEGHPDRGRVLHNLGLNLHIRFTQTGNLQDLQDSMGSIKGSCRGNTSRSP